jgi:dynein assembly factor 1
VNDERLFDIVCQTKCLYLSGNPIVKEIEHYRRTVVGKLKNLLYLDQRAVSEDERFLAERWVKEGSEGFKKAKVEL